ncbi:MAG: ROK family protein [Clostridiaceae bacterium]|nr:ROK family protein [Clostridiaceae bacterium]
MTKENKSGPVCILAVDAGGTALKTALVLADGSPLPASRLKVPVPSDGSAAQIQAAYQDMARQQAGLAARLGLKLSGIGVAICGPFDFTLGLSRMTHKYPAIQGIPMRPWFEAIASPLPVHFIHDSTAFMLGETWHGPHAGFARICGVMLGTGFGFGAMLDGQVLLNDRQGPGIIVYNRAYRDGIVEDYVSRRGILATYRRLLEQAGRPHPDEPFDVKQIGDLADAGDAVATETFRETGRHLAAILKPILLEYRFNALVVGGQIARSCAIILPPVKKDLAGLDFLTCIEQASLIDDAPILGVARACWQLWQP